MDAWEEEDEEQEAGFSQRGASGVSQPLQGHWLCPSSAETPAIACREGPVGIPAPTFLGPVCKPGWEIKVQPRAWSLSPCSASRPVSCLEDDQGINLI